MAFRNYDQYMIVESSLRNIVAAGVVVGYQFDIRYPSYRGTYLSCIEQLSFELDGKPIKPEHIFLQLGNKQFLMQQLPDLYKEYWETLAAITVKVMDMAGLSDASHTLTVSMAHRIPYSGYGGACEVFPGYCEKTLELAQGGVRT